MSQVTIAEGQPPERAVCYLDPARTRPNLVIEQAAMAEVTDPGRQALRRVRYAVAGVATRSARDARSDRLGGSINSPKLLELLRHRAARIAPRARLSRRYTSCTRRRESTRSLFARASSLPSRREPHVRRQRAWLAAGARGAQVRAVRQRLYDFDRDPDPHVLQHQRGTGDAGRDDFDRCRSCRVVGRQRHVAERQSITMNARRAALGERRLDPYQIVRSS